MSPHRFPQGVLFVLLLAALACSLPARPRESDEPVSGNPISVTRTPAVTTLPSPRDTTVPSVQTTPSPVATLPGVSPAFGDWNPPRAAEEWLSNPVRGAVIEIGYGGPDEYNDPPYPSVTSLRQLHDLGVRVVALEFQFAWSILPPYEPDEAQFSLVSAALDNVAAAGLFAVVAIRNGPGRNAMMPDIADADVITTLYLDPAAQAAYQDMLRDVVQRFENRPEIIAWEPIIEPALDFFLTGEGEPPYPQAAALWNSLAPKLIAAIREADPQRPILIEPVNWGGPDGFILLDRFEDDNLVYSLHTYEPFAYSHQEDPPFTAYPGTFEGEFFDREGLARLLEPVDAFQDRYRVPIVVGEWGGIRWLPGMARYIADQLSLFEARGWSWLWYAWDDEEWEELGFELQMGPDRYAPAFDPDTPAFEPLVNAWGGSPSPLASVGNWMYLIDVNLKPETVEQIAESAYDLVVLDFIPSEVNNTGYPVAEVVARLHNASYPKLVLAYIDIGQAEDYRTYWQPDWRIGNPDWIVALDPDGWEGNYPVAYWDEAWKSIWFGDTGTLPAILETGFDGVYLDWVEAYSDENVVAFAERAGVDPRQEMIRWVGEIAAFGRARDPDFIVIGQNAPELAAYDDYVEAIDAIAQEQVWFDGGADNDPPGDCPLPRTEAGVDTKAYRDSLSPPCRRQYDQFPDSTLHISSEWYLNRLAQARQKGLPIFTVDYAQAPENIAWVYTTSRGLGFIPFVSNRALDQFREPVP